MSEQSSPPGEYERLLIAALKREREEYRAAISEVASARWMSVTELEAWRIKHAAAIARAERGGQP